MSAPRARVDSDQYPQASARPDRCALRATARNDPMLGTAFPARRVLLVEQPGPWGIRGLPDSRFDPTLAATLVSRCHRNGIRVQAIRRPGRTDLDGPRRWALCDSGPSGRSIRWGHFDTESELLSTALSGPGSQEAVLHAQERLPADPAPADPVYLVCAHGTHDVCCAIEGRAVAAALDALRPGQVFETTHLGGDRFAASVLVLPLGVVYGRLPVEAVGRVVASTERGEAVTSHLRGLIGYSPMVQIALMYSQQLLGIAAVGELEVIDVGPLSPAGSVGGDLLTRVRLRAPRLGRTVRVVVEGFFDPPHLLTCRAAAPSRAARYELVSIEEEPDPSRA